MEQSDDMVSNFIEKFSPIYFRILIGVNWIGQNTVLIL